MYHKIIQIIVVAICFLILDSIWLGIIMKSHYNLQVNKIQSKNINLRWFGALFAYTMMIISVVWFSLPKVRPQNSFFDSMVWGGLLGLCLYGVFNGTNYAIFSNYTIKTLILDTLWGSFLIGITTFITFKITTLINKKA